jgi:hypothetical protein
MDIFKSSLLRNGVERKWCGERVKSSSRAGTQLIISNAENQK